LYKRRWNFSFLLFQIEEGEDASTWGPGQLLSFVGQARRIKAKQIAILGVGGVSEGEKSILGGLILNFF
jgi:hypothetical protein